MSLLHILEVLLLAIVQGAAELLPVSSSAHVAVVSRLIGLNKAGSPFEWAFLLVMLHTGTMFAVLLYFWPRWKPLLKYLPMLLGATVATLALGGGLKFGIERFLLDHEHHQKIESLFQNLPLIAAALVVVGVFIIAAGYKEARSPGTIESLSWPHAILIGLVQAICLPFRGLSRSGSTISTGM
ncbi:MAG TPA: undecaprenyl-diphosphate phosphatase, partial [Pirellulales bacterium]|nr:undecaprenyl-diphosphate phosphatase [Pirellulales bacterium]